MSQGLFFYFMKVGAGNAFMEFKEQLGELKDRNGLFVGYQENGHANRAIPQVTDQGEFLGRLNDKELRTIALASRDTLRAGSIACVFTDSHLTFWKITGYLRLMPEIEVQRFAQIPGEELSRALDYDEDWQAARAGAPGGQPDPATFFRGFHWLPAKLIHAVPRHDLLAPVDSLRVHRWLNSGTFRSLHSVKGNDLMGGMTWLTTVRPLDHTAIRSQTRETAYAKLVRHYLTGLIRPSTRGVLEDHQIADLAARWINPAQLETVGALLALDLGLTLEVGLGKGQDVVDVKASLRHLDAENRRSAAQSIVERVEKVLGVPMTQVFRGRLTEHGIFWIQCKAQDLDAGPDRADRSVASGPNPDLVLTLMPGANQSLGIGRLYLSRLMECVTAQRDYFPHLSNWQRVYMDQIRDGMCRPKDQS